MKERERGRYVDRQVDRETERRHGRGETGNKMEGERGGGREKGEGRERGKRERYRRKEGGRGGKAERERKIWGGWRPFICSTCLAYLVAVARSLRAGQWDALGLADCIYVTELYT